VHQLRDVRQDRTDGLQPGVDVLPHAEGQGVQHLANKVPDLLSDGLDRLHQAADGVLKRLERGGQLAHLGFQPFQAAGDGRGLYLNPGQQTGRLVHAGLQEAARRLDGQQPQIQGGEAGHHPVVQPGGLHLLVEGDHLLQVGDVVGAGLQVGGERRVVGAGGFQIGQGRL